MIINQPDQILVETSEGQLPLAEPTEPQGPWNVPEPAGATKDEEAEEQPDTVAEPPAGTPAVPVPASTPSIVPKVLPKKETKRLRPSKASPPEPEPPPEADEIYLPPS